MRIATRPAPAYMIVPLRALPHRCHQIHPQSPRASRPMQSPCIQVCAIDPRSGLCSGCGRTLDEIARWAEITDEERQRIMAALSDRLTGVLRAAGR